MLITGDLQGFLETLFATKNISSDAISTTGLAEKAPPVLLRQTRFAVARFLLQDRCQNQGGGGWLMG